MTRRGRLAVAITAGALAALAGTALMLDAAFPPVLDRYRERSAAVLDADGQLLRGFTTAAGTWRFAARPDEVDPLYLRMLKDYEDKRFDSHPGVDPLALARALGQWAASGRPVSGASTLTMQVVRLLEPRPRTLTSKAIEMLRALQLEWRYGKDEILALYLTVAPFGGNLEGVKAASRFYYGKPPKHLTPGEAALLVALPQSPENVRPDRNPDGARTARDKILERMARDGVLSAAAAAAARDERIPEVRTAARMSAPHLARRLASAAPDTEIHRTFLDGALQDTLQDLVGRAAERLEPGANAAVLIVENARRRVIAHVGSAGFLDAARKGQVDMTRAVRSPGSTLKPFIYAAAFDELNLHPETLITDSPQRFGDYAPLNFDQRFRGDVTLREALQLSLNVPAVAVLDRLGPSRFARLLERMGPQLRFDPRVRAPALPMALGGVGLSLEDLVTLYSGLAAGGSFKPLRFTETDAEEPAQRVIGEAAAWYVREILRNAPGPRGRLAARYAANGRHIAVKTGTSYGFRDAWAIGFDADYTVGVWVGRPDGGFGTGRTGQRQASRLLHDVFDLLPAGDGGREAPPADVLVARTADLPPPMRRFRGRAGTALARLGEESDFAISFPPDGATVEVPDDGFAALTLQASGGRKPLRWLVDGRPVASPPFKRSAVLRAPGAGQLRVTVLDADGRTASARAWIARVP